MLQISQEIFYKKNQGQNKKKLLFSGKSAHLTLNSMFPGHGTTKLTVLSRVMSMS